MGFISDWFLVADKCPFGLVVGYRWPGEIQDHHILILQRYVLKRFPPFSRFKLTSFEGAHGICVVFDVTDMGRFIRFNPTFVRSR